MPSTTSAGFDALTHPDVYPPLASLVGANVGAKMPTGGYMAVALPVAVPIGIPQVYFNMKDSEGRALGSGMTDLDAPDGAQRIVALMHSAFDTAYGAAVAKGWHISRIYTRQVDPLTQAELSSTPSGYVELVAWAVVPLVAPTVPGIGNVVGTYPRVGMAVGQLPDQVAYSYAWSCWAHTSRFRLLSGSEWDPVAGTCWELAPDVMGDGYPYYAYPYGYTVFPAPPSPPRYVAPTGSINQLVAALGQRQSLLISLWGFITKSSPASLSPVLTQGTEFGPLGGTAMEKNPMTGFTLAKLYSKVYSGQPDRYLRLVIPGYATGKKLGFHAATAPTVRPEWIAKMSEVPRTTPTELTDKLSARPVFIIPGRNGRVALLFGHYMWKDPVLCLNPGFISWQQRALTPEESTLLGRSQDKTDTMSQADCLWYFGPGFTRTRMPFTNAGVPDLHPAPLALYRTCVLGQGIKLMQRRLFNAPGHRGTEVVAFKAAGGHGAGVIDIHALYDSPYYDSNLGGGSGSGWEGFMLYSPGLTYNAGKLGLNTAHPTLAALGNDLAAVAKPLTDLLKVAVVPGSTMPFAFGSARIGFVTGLPHDTGPIMVEIGKVTDETGGVGAEVTWASIDLTGAQHKRMFPVGSLPADKQAEVSAKLDAIPNGMIFRTVMVPGGIKYVGSVKPENTQAAIDAIRVGGTIQEIALTDLEDPTKTITYGDLMVATDKAIAAGKNGIVMSPLAMDSMTLVSTADINAVRMGTSIVLQRAGADIAAAQALVAIRSGAIVKVPSGMTLDEVAVAVFGYPTWAAVLAALPSGAEGRAYLIDELANTNDLRFDMSADEVARGIPLLLGIDRVTTASVVGSQMLGVTAPELP